jgi:hypothetical protein
VIAARQAHDLSARLTVYPIASPYHWQIQSPRVSNQIIARLLTEECMQKEPNDVDE